MWINWEDPGLKASLPRLFLASQLSGGKRNTQGIALNHSGIPWSKFPGTTLFQALARSRIHDMDLSTVHEIRSGHGGWNVTCMSLDVIESRFLLTGGADGIITCVDLSVFDNGNGPMMDTKSEVKVAKMVNRARVNVRASLVSSLEWFPHDSGCFVSSDYAGNVSLWDSNEFRVAYTFDLSNSYQTYSGMPASTAASSSSVATRNKVLCARMQSKSSVTLIACGISDANVKLCDTRTGDSCLNISGHTQSVSCLQWNPENAHQLTSGSFDGTVKTWDIRRVGAFTHHLVGEQGVSRNHHQPMLSLDWRNDHTMVAKHVENDSYIVEEGLIDERYRHDSDQLALSKAYDGSVMSMTYTSCGNHLITAGTSSNNTGVSAPQAQHSVRLWDAATGKLSSIHYDGLSSERSNINTSLLPYQITVAPFNCSGDDLLAYPQGDSGNIIIVPVHSSRGKPFKVLKGHLSNVNTIVYRGNEFDQFISAGKDGMIFVWEKSYIPTEETISGEIYLNRTKRGGANEAMLPSKTDISQSCDARLYYDYWSD